MDKNSQQIPGFGFDPGYEPTPLPPQPAPSNNSIFGVISKVNKGILKNPGSQTVEPDAGKGIPSNVEQARAIAKKLSNISPQVAKQRIFQNAKNTIENIQKGIWNLPANQDNRQGISNPGFKVPAAVPTPKFTVPSNVGQGHGIVSNQGQGQQFSISNQQMGRNMYEVDKKMDIFVEHDRSKQTGSFTRKEALDEIDRYRGPASSSVRDQGYDDMNKKSEPFKSDFDRYYYGSETQRSEISGKLHRADKGGDFASNQSQLQSQNLSAQTSYKSSSDSRPHDDYQTGIDRSRRPVNDDNYRGFDNYQADDGNDYERYHGETYQQTAGEKYFQREPFRAEEEKGFGAERGNAPRNEYDPERWHYSGCDPNDDKPPDSSRMSRSYDDKWDNKKSQNENVPYVDEYDAYNKDSKNRTARPDERDYSRRRQESLDRYGSGSVESHDGYSQSPKVFDYGHTTRSSDRAVDTYQTSGHGDENERRTDDRFEKFSRDARERETDRRKDVGYRERESERTGYYGDRVQPNYKEGERDKFYDDYYHRERDERFDSRSEEYDHYGDDMANMEEFPEMVEHGDNKSQDGGMLYEDFLFGAEDDVEDIADYRRSGDGTGYQSREVDSESSRKRDDRSRSSEKKNFESRSRDKRYDSYRSRGSDNKGKEAMHGNRGILSRDRSKQGDRDIQRRDRYDDINDEPGIRKAERNLPITDDQKAQGVVANVPPANSEPMETLPVSGVLVQGLPPSVLVNQAPPQSRINSQAPPPSGIPAPAVAIIPPPGIICNDCNVTCLSEEIYKAHLTSDAHILTLQRKAQELFQMESRPSRFDVDSSGKPLKASVLPPTTMITGIASNTLPKPSIGMPGARNLLAGNSDIEMDALQNAVSRYRSKSDSDVQVIPPKPLGPLETRSVQCTWLILHWRTRHEDEEALIDKYVVEYRNAREIRWVRVGTTTKHEFEVNGLQEKTDYLFRVYTTNKDERSEYLESVLVTTKIRRDSSERDHRIARRDTGRDSGRRLSRDRVRRSSKERDRKTSRDVGRSSAGNRKGSGDRKPVRESDRSSATNRKRSNDRKRVTEKRSTRDADSRDSRHGKVKDNKSVKKTSSSSSSTESQQNKASTSDVKEVKQTDENVAVEKKTEEMDVGTEPEVPAEPVQEEVECLLYRELPNYVNEPMLGLDNIYEIRSYLPKIPPRYVCKLCNNKGSHKIIVKHIIGFPHKLNYFKKNNPEVFDVINVIALKKQQVERANYEARLEEDRIGRGSVRVMLMLNPEDNNGKIVYCDPILVKAPAPVRTKETGEAPEAYDVSFQSQFDDLYNEAIQTQSITDTTLIGLDYVREILHPRMEKEPKYTCSLCSVMCHNSTILPHILGKKHRTNYLRVYHEEAYDLIVSTRDQKHLLTKKIKEFAEKDGTGTIKTKVARNERLWRDKSSKSEDAKTQEEMETQTQGEDGVNADDPQAEASESQQEEEESQGGSRVQAIKFGIKKTEAPPTNVKPINVLDQDLATPKHKEAFDWTKENNLLQSRIQNESIIKCSRKSKFLTVYSEFFKRYPVIGIQWVTEFQKQDVKQEPWYMCSMCQHKLQWKNILDHVTSNLHRLNYMKKSDYRQMYNAVYHAIKKDKQSARPLIEQYSKEISSIEGPPTQLEVMLELKINTEAFKSVAKVQENVKAYGTATSTTQPSGIQINIASMSLSSKKVSEQPAAVTVEAARDSKPPETHLTNQPAQTHVTNPPAQTTFPSSIAPVLNPGTQIQQSYLVQPPQTVQAQVPALVQQQAPVLVHQQVQPPPLQPPLLRPPPLRPPPSASFPTMPYPQHNVQAGQVQGVSIATSMPPQLQYQSASNVSVPPPSGNSIQQFAPPVANNPAVTGGHQIQSMPVPFYNSNSVPQRQPLVPGPRPRPLLSTNPVQRPPPMPYPQMSQNPHLRPDLGAPSSLPVSSIQQPLMPHGQPPRMPVYSSSPSTLPNTPIISSSSSIVLSTNQHSNFVNQPPNSVCQRPPPWQKQNQTLTGPVPSLIPSSSQYGSSFNPMTTNNVTHLSTNSQIITGARNKEQSNIVQTVNSNAFNNKKIDLVEDRQRFDKNNSVHDVRNDEEKNRYNKQYNKDFDGRDKQRDNRESDRGIKRYDRESRNNDSNKRLRNEDRLTDIKSENVASPRRSPSFGRMSKDSGERKYVGEGFDRRKDRDLDRDHARDRRRSRSPFRSDRRSPPPQIRERDNASKFGNRTGRFSRRSDRRPSPGRETDDSHRRERVRENRPDNRREPTFYGEEQSPYEDYNEPLDEAKVDDLVRRYSGRVDEDYENFMGKETEWDDMIDTRFSGERQKDSYEYKTHDDRYFDERETYKNEFENRDRFENRRGYDDELYKRSERNERTNNVHSDRLGMGCSKADEFRDKTSRYGPYSRRGSDMKRNSREREYPPHANERRRDDKDVYLADRHRDRVEVQDNRYFGDTKRREGEETSRHVREWHEDFRGDDRNQGDFRRDRNERQSYNMGERRVGDAFDSRASGSREVSDERSRYRDDYDEGMYEEPNGDDDIVPDPSREEIDALLRRASTAVTPPVDEFNEYRNENPMVQTNRQGGGMMYSRGGRGRGGYRGRGGPRSGR